MPDELLTEDEHEALRLTGELANLLAGIVGTGSTRVEDMRELVGPLHAIQNAILAQAAARAYPMRYRRLGLSLDRVTPVHADAGGGWCSCGRRSATCWDGDA